MRLCGQSLSRHFSTALSGIVEGEYLPQGLRMAFNAVRTDWTLAPRRHSVNADPGKCRSRRGTVGQELPDDYAISAPGLSELRERILLAIVSA